MVQILHTDVVGFPVTLRHRTYAMLVVKIRAGPISSRSLSSVANFRTLSPPPPPSEPNPKSVARNFRGNGTPVLYTDYAKVLGTHAACVRGPQISGFVGTIANS